MNKFLSLGFRAALLCTLAGSFRVSAQAAGGVVNGITANAIVASDGSGDFKTVQAAVDAAPSGSTTPYLIVIKPGIYIERVVIPKDKTDLTLRGESPQEAEKTVITFHRYAAQLGPDGKPFGTSQTASVEVDADNFTAEDLTIENSAGQTAGQAVALMAKGDRAVFRHCRFLGWQDTLYLTGHTQRQYLDDCEIEGSVDFIFGYGTAALQNCRIYSKAPGCITAQARLAADSPTGFVFQNCTLTGAPDLKPGSIFLGRPWRPYSRVVYLQCTLGPQISPAGWSDWDKDTSREKTVFYAEYQDKTPDGKPVDVSQRMPWSHQLTTDQAAPFQPQTFLQGSDHWNPVQPTAH